MRPHDNQKPAPNPQRSDSPHNITAKDARMDQTTLNFLAGGVMGAFGWFARMLWERQEAHTRELAEFQIMVARDYVTNGTLGSVLTELKGDLRYIRDRLDETPMRRRGDPT